MDGPRRRVEAATRPLSSEHYHHGPARPLNPTSTNPVSLWETILYTLRLILEVSSTVALLAVGFVFPEVKSWITSIGMGKKFDPERDIGSLEGKVVLVTGGTRPRSSIAWRSVMKLI